MNPALFVVIGLVLLATYKCSGKDDPVAHESKVYEVAASYSVGVQRKLEDKISDLESEIATLQQQISGCKCAQ